MSHTISTTHAARNALTQAGISLTNVEFNHGTVHIFVDRGDGTADTDETDALKNRVQSILPWGGFMTGYGGYVLKPDYVALELDVNSTAHPCHY